MADPAAFTGPEITSEDVARGPPGSVGPLSVTFSPDGTTLAYLYPDHNGVRQVYAADLGTPGNRPNVIRPYKLFDATESIQDAGAPSLQEQLRRERMRLFATGVTSYEWDSGTGPIISGGGITPEAEVGVVTTGGGISSYKRRILVPMNGSILLYDEAIALASERLQIIYDSDLLGDAIDPQLSPDATAVAFVVSDDLYVLTLPPRSSQPANMLGVPRRLTREGGKEGISCGVADFIAQEEMDRYRGFWWSPDSRKIAYTITDETMVPKFDILHQGKADPRHIETHRYPFAGKTNPLVRLAVISVLTPSTATTSNTSSSTTATATARSTAAAGEGTVTPPTTVVTTSQEVGTLDINLSIVPRTQDDHIGPDGSVWMDLTGGRTPNALVANPSQTSAAHTVSVHNLTEDIGGTLDPNDYYLARVGWWPDGSVSAQVQNRAQSLLQLLRIDPHTGERTVMLEERTVTWINLHDMLHCMKLGWKPKKYTPVGPQVERDFYFVWGSDRSGYMQLYLYRYDAEKRCSECLSSGASSTNSNTTAAAAITPIGGGGSWIVESIDGVNAEEEIIYFSGNMGDHTQRHLYMAPLLPFPPPASTTTTAVTATTTTTTTTDVAAAGGGGATSMTVAPVAVVSQDINLPTVPGAAIPNTTTTTSLLIQVTQDIGYHNATVDVKAGMFADVYSSSLQPPVMVLCLLPTFTMTRPGTSTTDILTTVPGGGRPSSAVITDDTGLNTSSSAMVLAPSLDLALITSLIPTGSSSSDVVAAVGNPRLLLEDSEGEQTIRNGSGSGGGGGDISAVNHSSSSSSTSAAASASADNNSSGSGYNSSSAGNSSSSGRGGASSVAYGPVRYMSPLAVALICDYARYDARLKRMLPFLIVPVIERIPTAEELDPDRSTPPFSPSPTTLVDGPEAGGLFCALYMPDPNKFGPGPYPTIVSVYGGPGPQRVSDNWHLRVDLRAQMLVQLGFLVIRCDNRGAARRGKRFESAIKWNMGDIEVKDQVHACQLYAHSGSYNFPSSLVGVGGGIVDVEKVGIFGWSYGGYLSAMSLCREPGASFFKCAVAGAPVTSWDGYDTHYTERYMGRPEDNVTGYESSSVMTHAANMKGRLLLVHGLIDENVHFRHTARLINALIQHRKRYDLVLFPCERHSPHKLQDRVYLEDRMTDFLVESLSLKIGGGGGGENSGAGTAAASSLLGHSAAKYALAASSSAGTVAKKMRIQNGTTTTTAAAAASGSEAVVTTTGADGAGVEAADEPTATASSNTAATTTTTASTSTSTSTSFWGSLLGTTRAHL